jgi:alpha/beta superfamily hydrolase
MAGPSSTTQRTFELTSLDGHRLTADVAVPESIRAGGVIGHPHPPYGGTRHDRVVSALFDALPAAGVAALRFDFRSEFSDGVGERLDALAALEALAEVAPGVPLAMVGYSFGAWVSLGLDDDRIGAVVAVAPPLAVMSATPAPTVPTLVLTPAHDQFSPPSATEPIIADWRSSSNTSVVVEVIDMADHFLAGRTGAVADRTVSWLSDRWRLPSPPSPRR